MVRLLDKFGLITILHQEKNSGYEPFDRHNCGRMSLRSLKKCLDNIYNKGPKNTDRLNRVYATTAKKPLSVINDKGVVGFKMRFKPPKLYPLHLDGFPAWNRLLERCFRKKYIHAFKALMFDVLKRHDVVVLISIRQDVLRWGLSKYHGDGTGKPGHLQFKLARGAISKKNIGTVDVDCGRLEKIISKCETLHEEKRSLMEEFRQAGVQAHSILYEEFVTDRRSYLERLFRILELDITSDEISQVLGQEEYFKKVHSDDISEFVENHEEVTSRFADRFISWR